MPTWRQRLSVGVLIVASAALSSACSSLVLDVRSGENCREVFAVNHDNVAKTFSRRVRYRYGETVPMTVGMIVPLTVPLTVDIDTHYTIGAREEMRLGCTPECLGIGGCWYEIFDVRDAAPSPRPDEHRRLAGADVTD